MKLKRFKNTNFTVSIKIHTNISNVKESNFRHNNKNVEQNTKLFDAISRVLRALF